MVLLGLLISAAGQTGFCIRACESITISSLICLSPIGILHNHSMIVQNHPTAPRFSVSIMLADKAKHIPIPDAMIGDDSRQA